MVEGVNETIDAVNTGLTELCQRKEVEFTDVSPIFKLNDGTINDGYFNDDGIHLNKHGLNKLAKRLRLRCNDEAEGYVRKTEALPRDGRQDGLWATQGRRINRSTRSYAEATSHTMIPHHHGAIAVVHCIALHCIVL